MLTVNSQFEAELRKQVAERVETLKDNLATGSLSHEEYKRACGRIDGLLSVYGLCEDVNEMLNKR